MNKPRTQNARRLAETLGAQPSPEVSEHKGGAIWAIPMLCLCAAVVVAVATYASPLTTVRKVRLIVSDLLEGPELRCTKRRAQVAPGLSLARFDRSSYTDNLARLPWVRSVSAETMVSGDLIVYVTVRRPLAIVSCGGRRWEVDEDGVVIRPARKGIKLLEVAMTDPAPVRLGSAITCEATVGGLAAMVLGRDAEGLKPERIAVDQNNGICFNNGDKVAVSLGRPADLPYKIALIDRIYRKDPSLCGRIEAIDLSCPQSPACKRRATPRSAQAELDAG